MTQHNKIPQTLPYLQRNGSFFRLFVYCALAIITCTLLSSCAYFSQYSNIRDSRDLRIGMTKQQVLDIMGEPLRDQKFGKPDVWFYYVDTVWHDFLTTEDECMPLVFENGTLIGWGNDFYNQRQAPANPK